MQTYATTNVDGVHVIVYADQNVGRIFARASGCGGSGLTTEDAIADAMSRYENAGRPNARGYITPPGWISVPLKDISLYIPV